MLAPALPPLLLCTAWALPTAVLAEVCLPLAALLAAVGVLTALARAGAARLSGLAALPALLAALPAPAAPLPTAPPHGPAWIAGPVATTMLAPDSGLVVLVLGSGTSAARVVLDAELDALPGDHVELLVHHGPPPAPGLPASVHGLSATARVSPGPWSLRRLAGAARRALERQLLARIDGEAAGVLAALVLGRGTRPAGELQEAHRATGLSHLLAVSGAHAAMLAFLLGLTGWHGRPRPGRSRARTTVVLLLLAAYAAITGCEPPVLRAVAAYAIAAVAQRSGRPCGAAALLLVPALLTALVQPGALLGPSFLLSYAAVGGLALAGGPPRDAGALRRWLWSPLHASAFAALFTAPITLWYFGQVAPWTVLLTPLLAPLVAALLLGGLVVALLGAVAGAPADLLAVPLQALADGYLAAVRAADLLPGTPVPAPFAPPAWALALAGFTGACLLVAWPSRRTCIAVAVLGIAPHWLPLRPPAAPALHLFAVGHGQACLLTANGHHAAIDCGSLHAPFLASERLAAALDPRRLDLLVLTHGDHDHCNGIEHLLARVPITRAIVPPACAAAPITVALRAHGVVVQVLTPGERATPAPHLVVWAPDVPATAAANDQSLWVSAGIAGARVLLPGDAEELGTAVALAAGFATPHDLLVLPHHGRANAGAPALLRAVQPRVCFASAAAADGETPLGPFARAAGADLWVTGRDGSLWLGGEPIEVRSDRHGRELPARR